MSTTISFEYFKSKLEELATLINTKMDKGFPKAAYERLSDSTYYVSDLDKALKQMEDGDSLKITWPRLKWCLNNARSIRIEREQSELMERERKEASEFFHGDLPKTRCVPADRHCRSCFRKLCPEVWYQIYSRFRAMHERCTLIETGKGQDWEKRRQEAIDEYNRYVNETIYDEFPTRLNRANRKPLRSEGMKEEWRAAFGRTKDQGIRGVVRETEEGLFVHEPEGWEN